jgi:hypothetical protein
MDRASQADTVGGHGPADRASETSDARDRTSWTSPSYVEAVLFGRRWMRGSAPGSSAKSTAQTRKTPGEKAGAANEQERN